MKNTIVTLTVNIDVWIGIDEEPNVRDEVESIMSQLNHKDLEEFGGCQLLQYTVADIEDEDNHNCHSMYDHVAQINKGA